ncbi:hypothetical protein Emed_000183 [Eimeria media]
MHGECLPVFRSFLAKFNDIFNVQERVVLSGSWIGGCLHLAAVAACNVGDIRLEKEPDLRTNRDRVVLRHLGGDIDIRTFRDKPLQFGVGSHVGEFRLGSTIVLVFEAPQDFEFCVKPGQRILAGSRLGGVGPVKAAAAAHAGEETTQQLQQQLQQQQQQLQQQQDGTAAAAAAKKRLDEAKKAFGWLPTSSPAAADVSSSRIAIPNAAATAAAAAATAAAIAAAAAIAKPTRKTQD